MQTMVGSAFQTPVFSSWGAWAGGRCRISGPGAMPLTAPGSEAAVAVAGADSGADRAEPGG